MKDEETIQQKIGDITAILEMVDEPTFVSLLTTTRRALEWVLD